MVWEEHEEDELRRLFEEFERDKPSDDAVTWVMENMINKDRSRRSVIKKMKELNLIATKVPKFTIKWTEDQQEELKLLFNEYRESDDPLGIISDRLSVKKSKQSIKKMLLQLGLVQDSKELYKRRQRGGGSNRMRHEESDEGSSDDSDIGSDKDSERGEYITTERAKLDSTRPRLSIALREFLSDSKCYNYLEEGLKWVTSCLEDTLEDVDDDPADVPLLPLSEEAIKSIDNELFQKLLISIGVYSPVEQQEVYWRFPAHWKRLDILARLDLTKFLVGNFSSDINAIAEELVPMIKAITGEEINANMLKCGEQDSCSEGEERTALDSTSVSFDEMIARHCRETICGANLPPNSFVMTPSSRALNKGQETEIDRSNDFDKLVGADSGKTPVSGSVRKKKSKISSEEESTSDESSVPKNTSVINKRKQIVSSESSSDESTVTKRKSKINKVKEAESLSDRSVVNEKKKRKMKIASNNDSNSEESTNEETSKVVTDSPRPIGGKTRFISSSENSSDESDRETKLVTFKSQNENSPNEASYLPKRVLSGSEKEEDQDGPVMKGAPHKRRRAVILSDEDD